jgi:glycerol-3-phosphate acyltransferase PlsY
VKVILLSALSFLLGSIPTGLLVARSRGIDLRNIGSGNIGATNVLRTAGRREALLTLLGDVLKGALPVIAAGYYQTGTPYEGLIGLCAVLGHDFSVFLRFRGGKGVATSLGVLGVYSPQTGLVTIIIWLMTVILTRYSSLGALISFGLLPLSMFVFDSPEKSIIAFFMSVLIFWKHRTNITRLINGSEPKVGRKA